MDEIHFAGALLRMFRLERNWSQETLCQGICTVPYLSKIEQGKVMPNEALLRDLFAKMEIIWRGIPDQEISDRWEALYEAVFNEEEVETAWPDKPKKISTSYLDQAVTLMYALADMQLEAKNRRRARPGRKMS